MDSKTMHLSLVSFNHALTHGVVLSVPIAANYLQVELDITYAPIFLPLALFVFMYGIGAVLAGYLVDRVGAVKPMLVGMAITSVCMIALTLSHDLQWFSIWIIAAGFGLSFAHPSGLTLVSRLYVKKRGKAMGTFGFVGQFGQFIPPLAAGAIGAYYSWNYIFVVFFVLYLIALALCSLLLKSNIKFEEFEKQTSIEYKKALGGLFTTIVLLVLLLTALRGNYYRGMTSIMTYYAKDILDLDILTGAVFLSVMLISGFPGHLIGGWFADKHGPMKPLMIFSALSVVGVLLCLTSNLWVFIVGLCIVGFSFFSAQPAENVLTANVSSLNVRGMLYGLKFLVSFGYSSIALALIGVFADIYTLTIALYIILIFAVFSLLTVFMISMVYKGPRESKMAKEEEWDFE